MNNIAIRVENLGKQYKIGSEVDRYRTLRDSIAETVKRPINMLRHGPTSSKETIWALDEISFERIAEAQAAAEYCETFFVTRNANTEREEEGARHILVGNLPDRTA